jgi:ParB-like chromosome segregation protein Spo0J
MADWPAHPAAAMFPLLGGDELEALARDIEANGLREPVVTWAGTDGRVWLLDGRNRLRACRLAGVEPRSQAYEGDDPVGYIVSANLCRRHLNDSQRAMLAAKLANLRQGRASGQPANLPVAAPVSQAQAARLVEVSVRSLRSAKQVSERGVPELSEAVLAGEISVSRAAKVAGLPPSEQRELVGALRMRHYRGRQEWYTPAWLVELAREAMGGIDLDPASCEEANSVVKAAQIYTAADDGRLKPWKGRVFVNPPYALPLVEGFAAKLVAEYEAGRVTEAVWPAPSRPAPRPGSRASGYQGGPYGRGANRPSRLGTGLRPQGRPAPDEGSGGGGVEVRRRGRGLGTGCLQPVGPVRGAG